MYNKKIPDCVDIELSNLDSSEGCELKSVIDIDKDGNIIGCEIINFKYGMKNFCEISVVRFSGGPNVSYDQDSDCLYVRISHGQSVSQIVAYSRIYVNTLGEVSRAVFPVYI